MTQCIDRARAAWLVAGSLAATASAQSLVGSTFNYSTTGMFPNTSGSATVGSGTEFTFEGNFTEFDVDVDATGVTVIATRLGPQVLEAQWGFSGGFDVGSLTLSGLQFDDGSTIQSASINGGALDIDPGDLSFTEDSITIGARSGNNVIRFFQGSGLRVTIIPDPCPGPNVTNQTTNAVFETIDAAVAAASNGDTLVLGPCVFNERGIALSGKDLTIRGAGKGQTIIDGQGIDGPILSHAEDASTVENLTIRNALSTFSSGSVGAVAVRTGSDVVYRDVEFRANRSAATTACVTIDGGDALLERCSFFDNVTGIFGSDVSVQGITAAASGRVINCAFDDATSPTNRASYVDARSFTATGFDVDLDVVNSTFLSGPLFNGVTASGSFTSLLVGNSVFEAGITTPAVSADTPPTIARNVHPSLSGNNIAAAPQFMNPGTRDYRLLAGTPGVDAGDASLYFAAGGGVLDAAGIVRFFDDPTSTNFDDLKGPIDAGAFELPSSADSTPSACPADIALPTGVLDLGDIDAFIAGFLAGCP